MLPLSDAYAEGNEYGDMRAGTYLTYVSMQIHWIYSESWRVMANMIPSRLG